MFRCLCRRNTLNSNELIEHIRRLNELERAEHEQRKQAALNKIRQRFKKIKEQENARNVVS